MNHQWSERIFLPQATHLFALRFDQRIWLPLARAGRKNLECIGAQPISPFRSTLNPTCSRSMDSYAPGTWLWRLTFGPKQDVLHAQFALWSHQMISAKSLILTC